MDTPRIHVSVLPRYLHASALARLGQLDEARAIAKIVLDLHPGFSVRDLVSGDITGGERMTMLAEALREAELPE